MKRRSITLTDVEIDTVFWLIKRSLEDGIYYGPREQYRNRLLRILTALRLFQ